MVDYPKDWKEIKVKDFGSVVTGNTPKTDISDYWGGNFIWITPTDINNKVFIENSERKLTEEGYAVSRKLKSGTVLITCIASIGKNCILSVNGACNQQINAITVNENNSNVFIYYLIGFNKSKLENLAGSTATKILKKNSFEMIKFRVPQLPEQNLIAETLMTFDKHLENLERLIQKKKMVRGGAVEDLMTGKTRHDGFDGGWITCKLNLICNVYDGTHQTPHYISQGIRFVSVEDINNIKGSNKYISESDFSRDFKIYPTIDDILMTRIGDIGTATLIKDDEKLAYYVSLALFKNIKINSNFLLHYIKSSNFKQELDKRLLHHATPIKINKNDIGECIVSYPKDIQEQKAIADILTSMDEEIENLEKEKAKVEKIKAGAMEDLLTGRIRLI